MRGSHAASPGGGARRLHCLSMVIRGSPDRRFACQSASCMSEGMADATQSKQRQLAGRCPTGPSRRSAVAGHSAMMARSASGMHRWRGSSLPGQPVRRTAAMFATFVSIVFSVATTLVMRWPVMSRRPPGSARLRDRLGQLRRHLTAGLCADLVQHLTACQDGVRRRGSVRDDRIELVGGEWNVARGDVVDAQLRFRPWRRKSTCGPAPRPPTAAGHPASS